MLGGSALKNVYTRRYDVKEYFTLRDEIMELTQKEGIKCRVLDAFNNKQSFGDMDVLILNDGNLGNIKNTIESVFKPNEMFFNGNVWSFDYKELQIDFILTPTRNWESAFNFFRWNDLGNLMGKIAHKFNLSYGFEGLCFKYRMDNAKFLGDIVLSKNPEVIFNFLGFDYNRWLKGFDEMEDIFEYVINSKYFSSDIFSFENLNHIDKKRNKKRKMYNQFLEYCNSRTDLKSYSFEKDKSKYHDMIDDAFPGFKSKIEEFKLKEERRKVIASKFNGKIIIQVYGITGEELGEKITMFKSLFTDFNEYVYSTESNIIWEDFEVFLMVNNAIKGDPIATIRKLKEVWNDDDFKDIRSMIIIPEGYESLIELSDDLAKIGFNV